jgi:polar amino acid transport system substrate-binding protein
VPGKQRPGELVVALSLPRPAFAVGAVRGSEVVVARGLEAEVARVLARRLRLRPRFVQVGDARRLLASGAKRWDVAIARLVPTAAHRRAVDFSAPYARADQIVLLARGLERPRSLAGLQKLQLCAQRGTRGVDAIAGRVRPALAPLLARDLETLLRRVQTGACDAAVGEVGDLGPAIAAERGRFGPVAGRIPTGAYAIALEDGSPLKPSVEQAMRALSANGTLRRLAKKWLGIDLPRVRVLA